MTAPPWAMLASGFASGRGTKEPITSPSVAPSPPASAVSSDQRCDVSTRGHRYRSGSRSPPRRGSTRATPALAAGTSGTEDDASDPMLLREP